MKKIKTFFQTNKKILFIILITSIFIFLNYISINKKNILLTSTGLYLIILSAYIFFIYKQTILVFVHGLKMEVKTIYWPTKKEMNQTTLMVIVITLLASIILWIVDSILTYIISKIV